MWKLERMSKPHSISTWNVENYLYDVGQVINHYNNTTGKIAEFRSWRDGIDFYLAPLSHYVGTGRASSEFLHLLVDAKPFMIARVLMKDNGGTYDEAIGRVKEYLGYDNF